MFSFLKKSQDLCVDNGYKLLYLSKFGSHLYGTNTEKSDLDFKGIFLPKKDDLLLSKLKQIKKSITYSNSNPNVKNDKTNYDIQLWSLQYWLYMLKQGETGAIDLLFSPTNQECFIFKDSILDDFFNNPLKLLDIKNTDRYVYYAINQARKYGIKGSRLGALKKVYDILTKAINDNTIKLNDKLQDVMHNFHDRCYDQSYCFVKVIGGEKFLILNGKKHLYNITVKEFLNRIESDYHTYGKRARLACVNQGIDWKAISHSIRCIIQMKHLLRYGYINFPLKESWFLKKIKNGEIAWKKLEKLIVVNLKRIKTMQKECNIESRFDKDFVYSKVLSVYS